MRFFVLNFQILIYWKVGFLKKGELHQSFPKENDSSLCGRSLGKMFLLM